jgi:hypothetical protein
MYTLRCARQGRGRSGLDWGSAARLREVQRSAKVYLYSMQAFALAIIVHCTVFRSVQQPYQKLVAVTVAVLMLGVLVDTSYTLGPLNRAPILERLAKAAYSYTATQPQI